MKHPASIYRDTLFRLVQTGTRWLDVGCGHAFLPPWLPNSEADQRSLASRCRSCVGLDAEPSDNPFLTERHVGDATALPFPDNSFDLVTAHMVVEHLPDPTRFINEACRVLVPGGRLVIATPNLHNYLVVAASVLPIGITRKIASFLDGRNEHDIFPTFYRLNTRRRMLDLARHAGMEVESVALLNQDSILRKVPPLYVLDALLVALLQIEALAECRPNILALFRKPVSAQLT